jgi:hypothetical protein
MQEHFSSLPGFCGLFCYALGRFRLVRRELTIDYLQWKQTDDSLNGSVVPVTPEMNEATK